ncbi:MAG: hypothetical protein EOP78_01770 [Variovorax sp.]|nr:MAG: hypothetical protein EOP78_01770 [Variovorax sp.]
MKKFVLIASLVAAAAFSACGKKEDAAPAVVTPPPATVTPPAAPATAPATTTPDSMSTPSTSGTMAPASPGAMDAPKDGASAPAK